MFRLLKVLKVLRVIRVLRAFRDLRVIMHAVYDAFLVTFWSMIVLMCTMFVFSMFFMQGIVSATDSLAADQKRDMSRWFGSLDTSMGTLFACISGGTLWMDVARDVSEAMGAVYYFMFISFICFANFSVLNMILGIGVDGAMKIVAKDYEQVIHEMVEKNDIMIGNFKELFQEMDTEGDGCLGLEDFGKLLHDSRAQVVFHALEIDVVDAEKMFRMLAKGEHNKVSIDELTTGCMKLKGYAKSIDIACLLSLAGRTLSTERQFIEWVEDELASQDQTIEQMCNYMGVRKYKAKQSEPSLKKMLSSDKVHNL
jgi:hypothetical protein